MERETKKAWFTKQNLMVGAGAALVCVGLVLFVFNLVHKQPSDVFLRELNELMTPTVATGESSKEGSSKLETAIINKSSYQVIGQTEDSVTLQITAPDMSSLLYEGGKSILNRADAIDVLCNQIESGDFSFVENEVTVQISDDGTPVETFELTDALYGNLFSEIEKQITSAATESEIGGN